VSEPVGVGDGVSEPVGVGEGVEPSVGDGVGLSVGDDLVGDGVGSAAREPPPGRNAPHGSFVL
jgi:hypothetical protein